MSSTRITKGNQIPDAPMYVVGRLRESNKVIGICPCINAAHADDVADAWQAAGHRAVQTWADRPHNLLKPQFMVYLVDEKP